MPSPFSMWGRAYNVTAVRMKNGFYLISFEKISVLDSHFIHRYIIIKYRSSLV